MPAPGSYAAASDRGVADRSPASCSLDDRSSARSSSARAWAPSGAAWPPPITTSVPVHTAKPWERRSRRSGGSAIVPARSAISRCPPACPAAGPLRPPTDPPGTAGRSPPAGSPAAWPWPGPRRRGRRPARRRAWPPARRGGAAPRDARRPGAATATAPLDHRFAQVAAVVGDPARAPVGPDPGEGLGRHVLGHVAVTAEHEGQPQDRGPVLGEDGGIANTVPYRLEGRYNPGPRDGHSFLQQAHDPSRCMTPPRGSLRHHARRAEGRDRRSVGYGRGRSG